MSKAVRITLRTALGRFGSVLLIVGLVCLSLAHASRPSLAAAYAGGESSLAATGDTGPGTPDLEPGRSAIFCQTTGACLVLSDAGNIAARASVAEVHPPMLSADAPAKWVVPPFDQPPRLSA